jgi:predicted esterase
VRFPLAILILFCELLLTTAAFATEQPPGTSFEISLTLKELLGEQEASRYQKILSPDDLITWSVYLPVNDGNQPPGVLVYVSPLNLGRMETAWRSALDQHNLIWIGANKSGNRKPVDRRMVMALLALKALEKDYLISSNRIIVSGFSGGGRVASMLASQYPEVFSGAIYICGVNYWNDSLNPRIDRLVQNRFVFLTGSKDFNRTETQKVYRRYLKAGAEHSLLLDIPGMSHELPGATAILDALEFLDK